MSTRDSRQPAVNKSIPPEPPGSNGQSQGKSNGKPKAKDSPSLVITIDAKQRSVESAALLDDEQFSDLEQACQGSREPVVFRLDDLLGFNDDQRLAALSLMAGSQTYRYCVGDKQYRKLFFAVLKLTPNVKSHDSVRNFQFAAVEVAALQHGDTLDLVCAKIALRMRELGIKGVHAQTLVRDARTIITKLASEGAESTYQDPRPVRAILPDAPVGDDVLVPRGWELSPDGVSRIGVADPAYHISAPLVITERLRDTHRSDELLKLAWWRDDRWCTRVVAREQVADTRSVVKLAGCGAPVTSISAPEVVKYLSAYEKTNFDRLPVSSVSSQLGWQGAQGGQGFLLGKTLVTGKGLVSAGTSSATGSSAKTLVQFRGADDGDDQIAEGYHQAGTLENWLAAIAPVANYDPVKLGLYASFVPPILMILRAPNFGVDFAGETTGGKTVTLRIAGSVWGNPDEKNPSGGSAVYTWVSTTVWRERASAILNNLPVILDDTKGAPSREDVERTIYGVSEGRGKGRGSIRGLARQGTWQTVLISSGEAPMTSFTHAGGTRARILTLWGSPFGVKDAKTGALVRRINQAIKRHYGHAGPLFLQFLQKERGRWPELRKAYLRLVDEYEKRAGDNALAGRLAEHFAAIRLTAQLVHEAIKLPWDYEDPIEPLWDDLVREAGDADRATAALRHVMEWAVSHQDDFFPQPVAARSRQPSDGWAGVWEQERLCNTSSPEPEVRDWDYIGFMPSRVEKILRGGNFEPQEIIRLWYDRKWLRVSKERGVERTRFKTRLAKKSVWVVAIKRTACDTAGAL